MQFNVLPKKKNWLWREIFFFSHNHLTDIQHKLYQNEKNYYNNMNNVNAINFYLIWCCLNIYFFTRKKKIN